VKGQDKNSNITAFWPVKQQQELNEKNESVINHVQKRIHLLKKLMMNNFQCVYFLISLHINIYQMRTNIELDDILVQQALKLSKIKTKKDVIHEALKNYVSWMKKKQLLDLKGQLKWEGSLKDMRKI
jgi:Arc/MetJ family transcription regulator